MKVVRFDFCTTKIGQKELKNTKCFENFFVIMYVYGMKAVILDNIRSVHNVGSIFRTADALGVEKIFLCGTTPTPIDRFGRDRKDLTKVALGAEKTIAWEYCEKTEDAIKKLKAVMGEEVKGIQPEILNLCDLIAEIPMQGVKESLNVSVAFGIAGYVIFTS